MKKVFIKFVHIFLVLSVLMCCLVGCGKHGANAEDVQAEAETMRDQVTPTQLYGFLVFYLCK